MIRVKGLHPVSACTCSAPERGTLLCISGQMDWSTVDGTCVPLLSCCTLWGHVISGYFGINHLPRTWKLYETVAIKQPLTLAVEEALHFLEGLAGVATTAELAWNQDRPIQMQPSRGTVQVLKSFISPIHSHKANCGDPSSRQGNGDYFHPSKTRSTNTLFATWESTTRIPHMTRNA